MRIGRLGTAITLPLLLAACFGGGDRTRDVPPKRIAERPSGPRTLPSRPSAETQQCYTDLSRANVRYSALPDRDFGGGCLVIGAVQLLDIGVPVTGITSIRCPLARNFSAWVEHAVRPAARQMLGSELVRVETMGTYSCRGIVGGGTAASGRLSEHALANAIDVSGFVLADGRRITIRGDWRTSDPATKQFLTVIHQSACKRFRTVLSPEYNAAHHDHFHFDMGRGPFCR
jgi:hypothetical protein